MKAATAVKAGLWREESAGEKTTRSPNSLDRESPRNLDEGLENSPVRNAPEVDGVAAVVDKPVHLESEGARAHSDDGVDDIEAKKNGDEVDVRLAVAASERGIVGEACRGVEISDHGRRNTAETRGLTLRYHDPRLQADQLLAPPSTTGEELTSQTARKVPTTCVSR